MDEHMIVEGGIGHLNADISDINLKNITFWTDKHNHYSNREAVGILLSREPIGEENPIGNLAFRAKLKRFLKTRLYARLPLGLRAFLYFSYRYFLRLGFLDGWEGIVFHFLQGFWYRFLVDVKVHELKTLMKTQNLTLEQAVRQEFGYEIGKPQSR
jgi:hypothetical protein